ncbi:MAG: hypothetical protein ACXVQY_05465 [Actinomycetota bacterium]
MHLTKRDALATVLIAALVVPYIGYLINGSMPFLKDARGMSGLGLLLGIIAIVVGGQAAFGRTRLGEVEIALSVATLGLGIAALWLESDAILVPFIVGIVMLWGLEILTHAGVVPIHSHPSDRLAHL